MTTNDVLFFWVLLKKKFMFCIIICYVINIIHLLEFFLIYFILVFNKKLFFYIQLKNYLINKQMQFEFVV